MVADPAIDAIWLCGPNQARIENVYEVVHAALAASRAIAPTRLDGRRRWTRSAARRRCSAFAGSTRHPRQYAGASRRPTSRAQLSAQLFAGERIIEQQDGVGLYDGCVCSRACRSSADARASRPRLAEGKLSERRADAAQRRQGPRARRWPARAHLAPARLSRRRPAAAQLVRARPRPHPPDGGVGSLPQALAQDHPHHRRSPRRRIDGRHCASGELRGRRGVAAGGAVVGLSGVRLQQHAGGQVRAVRRFARRLVERGRRRLASSESRRHARVPSVGHAVTPTAACSGRRVSGLHVRQSSVDDALRNL